MSFLFASIYIPFFYMEEYAKSQNFGLDMAGYTLTMANAASFFGRIFPNLIANRYAQPLLPVGLSIQGILLTLLVFNQ